MIDNDKAITSIEFKFDTIKVYPLSNSIANYTGTVSGKMIESGTLIKHKNGWKLLNGQSRNLP